MIVSGSNEYHPAIIGIGMPLPENRITNDQLVADYGVNSTDMDIRKRSGIESRHWISGDEALSSLAAQAAEGALGMANISAEDLGEMYVATFGPSGPNLASKVHGEIAADEHCGALDINAACAGGAVALQLATQSMGTEMHSHTLAMGAEIMSRDLDLDDRRTAILFGDASGGAVLGWVASAIKPAFSKVTRPDRNAIYRSEPECKIIMDGPRVAEYARTIMPEAARRVARTAGITINKDDPESPIDWSKVDYFVPHQANLRIIEAVGENLGVPEEKLVASSVVAHGNTSSASIFLAMTEAYRRGQIEGGLKTVLGTTVASGMQGVGFCLSMMLPGGPAAEYPILPHPRAAIV